MLDIFSTNPVQGKVEGIASFLLFRNSSIFHAFDAAHILCILYFLHCSSDAVGAGARDYSLHSICGVPGIVLRVYYGTRNSSDVRHAHGAKVFGGLGNCMLCHFKAGTFYLSQKG